MKPGVLLLNFGGPSNDDELKPFLYQLFCDVLPGPKWLRPALAKWVSSRRAEVVRVAYRQIGFSPLVETTAAQAEALRGALGENAPPIAIGMTFTPPFVGDGLERLREAGVDQVIALALFPQFSLSTTSSAYQQLHDLKPPPVHWIPAFYDHPDYNSAVGETITEAAASLPGEGPIHLLFSPHGLPLSFIRRGDPYPDQIRETVRRVMAEIRWDNPWHLGWQSRVGPVKWLTPSTEQEIARLGAAGADRLLVVPISFVGDHIETLHEIDIEYAQVAHESGITHFGRAATLGVNPRFISCLADVVRDALRNFDGYRCVRCLIPKPASHRERSACPNCTFTTPEWLRT